jgi:hypothetical protein
MELRGPRAKLERAFARLRDLDRECNAYLETEPFRAVAEFDEEIGSHEVRLRGREDLPVFRWGLMVGDVVHNARSALDQAAWLMACRSTPVETLWQDDIGWRISFPVTSKPSRFRRHSVLKFLADDAKELIESVQPYNGGDLPEALGRLDRLWNIDKHRVIHSTTGSLDVSKVKFRPRAINIDDLMGGSPRTTFHELPNPVPDGAVIASVRFASGDGPPLTGVEVTGGPSVQFAFGSGFFALPIDGIGELLVQSGHILTMINDLPEHAEGS